MWQYYRNKSNNNLTDFESFKSEIEITGNTSADGNTKNVEIMVLLKYLSILWRKFEIPLINCEIMCYY